MDFLNKFGNMVGKGFDSIKTQINKAQENLAASNNQASDLPKGVHILGIDDSSRPQSDYTNLSNTNNTTNNDYNKYYYGNQQNDYQPLPQNQNQNKPTSSSIRDLFNINQQQSQQPQPQSQPPKGKTPDKEFMQGYNLIHGEKVIEWERCSIKLDRGTYYCRALITNYRVYIIPDLDQAYANYFPDGYFSLPIHKIEKTNRIQKPQVFEFILEIIMYDARVFPMIFKTSINENFPHVLNGLLSSKEIPSFSQLAYDYNTNNPIYKKENFEDGWKLYDPEKEFQRLKKMKTIHYVQLIPNF